MEGKVSKWRAKVSKWRWKARLVGEGQGWQVEGKVSKWRWRAKVSRWRWRWRWRARLASRGGRPKLAGGGQS